ncbi:MAG: rod shape-determining protein MreC [Candidatus Moranbacteria bacterium]|nr:rod shape-determining protein MreC [Candidatus Moranbacteria bacterium]
MIKNIKKGPGFKAFWIILVILIIFIVNLKGLLNPIKNYFAGLIFHSLGSTQEQSASNRNFFSTLSQVEEIIAQNRKLTELEVRTKELSKQNQELKQQNQELRQELDLIPKEKFNLATAEIIAHDPNASKEIVVINKGTKHGIKKGDAVIIHDQILIGEIYEANIFTSKVVLTISPISSFDARVTETDIIGVAQGRFNLEILLKSIPEHAEIKNNQLIVTAGKDKKLPPGLIVGEITSINQSKNGLFKQAKVQPFYSLNNLNFVSVIINEKTS